MLILNLYQSSVPFSKIKIDIETVQKYIIYLFINFDFVDVEFYFSERSVKIIFIQNNLKA